MSATGREHTVMDVFHGKLLELEIKEYETDFVGTDATMDKSFIAGDGTKGFRVVRVEDVPPSLCKRQILELAADYLNLKAKEMRDENRNVLNHRIS